MMLDMAHSSTSARYALWSFPFSPLGFCICLSERVLAAQFCFGVGESSYRYRFSESVVDKGYSLMLFMDEIWDEVMAEKVRC